jgi:predicted nucleotidyltransferase
VEPLDRIAETLAAHQVNFVVIGNYGARLHGVEVQTEDADMAFQRERQNLERLMSALADLDAAIRFEGGTVPLPTHDPVLLARGEIWNLRTVYGDLDLLYSPAGGGYEDLLPNAEWVTVRGYPVLVASLDDIIRSKELADRVKDHQTLDELRRFRDEQLRQTEGPGLSFDM